MKFIVVMKMIQGITQQIILEQTLRKKKKIIMKMIKVIKMINMIMLIKIIKIQLNFLEKH